MMHPRVRLLYMEYMYLVSQLSSFYTPRATTTTVSTAGATDSPNTAATLTRPFFLRVAQDHPVCATLRHANVIEFATPRRKHAAPTKTTASATTSNSTPSSSLPPASTPASSTTAHGDAATVVVFKLRTEHEMALLDPHMPRNWRSKATHTSPHRPAQVAEAEFRAHVQRLFYTNALLPAGTAEWKRCLARGRYELRGMQTVVHVRKYRAMQKRYGWASQLSRPTLEAAWEGDMAQVEQALLGLSNRDVYGYAEESGEGRGNG